MEIPVRPVVLISYSHQDEIWKDRLKTQLRVLEKQGRLTLWEDRRISAGGDWYREIKSAIEAADVAVLLISADFLTSDFIQNEEVSRLLRRREEGGLRIFPVIVNSCPWREVAWLRSLQVSPKDGKPLSKYGGDRLNEVLSEIATRCLGHAVAPGVAPAPPNSAPAPKVSIGALASPEHKLFGRERELELLDEVWDDRDTNIFVLVAMGGVGKSSLIKHWLDRMAREGYRGAERVYEWSFYSQGTTDQAVSADLFIDSALRWFGDANPAQGSPRDKGERLAELIRRERTLLILDGLEPLQYPPGRQEGRLKDPTLRVLLRALAGENPGLCVINTRLRVSDLESFGEEEVSQFDLDPLSKQAGAQLLKALGVNGDEAELEQAAEEFKGHSLALLLLGSYLRYAFDDAHIRHRNEVENLEKEARYGEHAQHVMASYEKWFGEGPEVAVLRMLGLFKRPADAGALAALREQPPIPGLTDALQPLSEQQWNLLIAELRRAKLLAERDYRAAGVLDAHPLIREHFGRQLKQERPVAWREGNKRLYQHLKSTTRKYPETLAEMAPLYAAVAHGCEADLHHEALTEVYRARILRENQFFSTSKLGAFSAELATLANFFERPWMRPVGNLGEASRAFVLHEAGFDLRALGRLVEAAQPMRASLGAYISQEDWNTATVNAGQLSHIYLVIGELDKALKYARLCVTLADLSGDDFWRPRQRAALAKTLHYMGRLAEAEEIFGEAEEMQKRLEPRRPQLYALWGHFYCDLLLSLGRYRDAQSRASRSLQWIKAKDWMLMLATDHLSLGRAYMLRARREGRHHLRSAEKHLKNAVDKLRQAGRLDHLPRGLLALAELRLMQGDFRRAWNNLHEAMSIAQSGNMTLHQADCHLRYARLHLEEGDREKSRESMAVAGEMIGRMGYHLRDEEVRELEARLGVEAAG